MGWDIQDIHLVPIQLLNKKNQFTLIIPRHPLTLFVTCLSFTSLPCLCCEQHSLSFPVFCCLRCLMVVDDEVFRKEVCPHNHKINHSSHPTTPLLRRIFVKEEKKIRKGICYVCFVDTVVVVFKSQKRKENRECTGTDNERTFTKACLSFSLRHTLYHFLKTLATQRDAARQMKRTKIAGRCRVDWTIATILSFFFLYLCIYYVSCERSTHDFTRLLDNTTQILKKVSPCKGKVSLASGGKGAKKVSMNTYRISFTSCSIPMEVIKNSLRDLPLVFIWQRRRFWLLLLFCCCFVVVQRG